MRCRKMRYRFVDAKVLRQAIIRKTLSRVKQEPHTLDKPILFIGRHPKTDLVLGGAKCQRHGIFHKHDSQRMIRALVLPKPQPTARLPDLLRESTKPAFWPALHD